MLNIFNKLYYKLLQKTNRVKHAKKIGVNLAPNVRLIGTTQWGTEPWLISIGSDTLISNNVKFTTHDGGLSVINKWEPYKSVLKFGRIDIGKNCFIGADTRLMPDIIIGDNVVIGAESVVTKDVPSNQVWAGVPAKYICSIEEYADKLLAQTPQYDDEYCRKHLKEETTRIANEIRQFRRSSLK